MLTAFRRLLPTSKSPPTLATAPAEFTHLNACSSNHDPDRKPEFLYHSKQRPGALHLPAITVSLDIPDPFAGGTSQTVHHESCVPTIDLTDLNDSRAVVQADFSALDLPLASAHDAQGLRTMWWDEATISAKVTRSFVLAQLKNDEKANIDQRLKFGGGLTDDTYLDWILQKTQKLFLILTELGFPDQIFGLIDDGWNDDDLPVPFDIVFRLRLTRERDEKVERQFWIRQYEYLLRPVEEGCHIDYSDQEVVPVAFLEKKIPGLTLSNPGKVYILGNTDVILQAKQMRLGYGPGLIAEEDFVAAIHQMRALQHKHIVSLWGSYTHKNMGCLLLSPVSSNSLRTFISSFPPSIKNLAKPNRRALFLTWLHCLADGLAFLHSRGSSHGAIKPTNIGLDECNQLFFSTRGRASGPDEPRGFDKEQYDFAAPETIERAGTSTTKSLPLNRTFNSVSIAAHPRTYSLSAVSGVETSSIHSTSTSSNEGSYSTITPYDPQAADVFSLGCIFLEVLSQLMKRTSRNFTSHRGAKNKSAGRGGSVPDSSFHKNLDQVESWAQTLRKDAVKRDEAVFQGVGDILSLTVQMIAFDAAIRPSSIEVRNRLGSILVGTCGLSSLCCCKGEPVWKEAPTVTPRPTTPVDIVSRSPESPGSPLSPLSQLPPFNMRRDNRTFSISAATIASMTDSMSSATRISTNSNMSFRTITGDGKEVKERRYASGGGRTAKPRPRPSRPSKATTFRTPDYSGPNEFKDDKDVAGRVNDTDDFDVGSMYELRLYDYENGGEVKKVGWENL